MTNTAKLARGGLLTALTVILLYVTNLIPTSKLSVLTAASAVIPIAILTIGVKYSTFVYAASSLLALALGLRAAALAYIVFFGLFGFVKYYLESMKKTVPEIILKLLFFNASMLLIYYFYSTFLLSSLSEALPIYLILIVAQFAFILYDFALTSIINYLRTVLKIK